MKQLLSDFNSEEIREALDIPPYKAKQIFRWLAKGCDFAEMSDQSKAFRETLQQNYFAQGVKKIKRLVSEDGTEKYLFALNDGAVVEGVLMKYKYGNTLCVSTQAGCRMGCAFCASTLNGLERNLSAGEIYGEVVAVNRLNEGGLGEGRAVTNVVLMGSGEPLDNYDNVIGFLRLLNSPDGLNVSYRNISLSTCGLVPQIIRLADEGIAVNLTVSLHSPFQHKRIKLMPVSKKYPLLSVVEAAKYYFEKTGRRVYFEYTLISGENDSDEDAERLAELLKGFPAHINLIRLNPVRERRLKGTGDSAAAAFAARLQNLGLSVTLRRRMGADIDGACGQLRKRYLEENGFENG